MMKISQYTNDAIALMVVAVGTGCAAYLTYVTGQIPEFFSVGFGVVLMYFFKRSTE